MATKVMAAPRLRKGQKVSFIGGSGVIRGFQPEAGTWSYLVEMELGPEPEMGRIGYETMILLSQADLTLPSEAACFEFAYSA
ncbi:hypothetical protein NDI52_07380 [Leptolyngbya sp. PL-A3]|uniref:hypothetical protein n=1 Tax=Leptolyngbya sp. PL-A3 TaxID=2933911 RepID=UPI0032998377